MILAKVSYEWVLAFWDLDCNVFAECQRRKCLQVEYVGGPPEIAETHFIFQNIGVKFESLVLKKSLSLRFDIEH